MKFVGTAEIRRMIGVTRQRVNQIVDSDPAFPDPVAVLEMGRVWRAADVEEWARLRDRAVERHTVVPATVWSTVLGGFVEHEAHLAITELPPARRGEFLHAGDPVGRVMAWLWRDDREAAARFLAQYVMQLRVHDPDAPTPPITLDDVLGALLPAMPPDFSAVEYREMCSIVRVKVQELCGATLD